jgi:hypothetical protein
MKFALILVLFWAESPTVTYAIKTDMSAIDCAIALVEQESILLQTFAIDDFSLHCNGVTAYEDS